MTKLIPALALMMPPELINTLAQNGIQPAHIIKRECSQYKKQS